MDFTLERIKTFLIKESDQTKTYLKLGSGFHDCGECPKRFYFVIARNREAISPSFIDSPRDCIVTLLPSMVLPITAFALKPSSHGEAHGIG